jgi:lysophospholipase L1-like esterase
MPEPRRVLRSLGVATLLYLLAFAAVTAGGANRSKLVVWGAGALLVAAAILFQLAMGRARSLDLFRRARRRVPLALVATGAVLAAVAIWTKVGGGALALFGVSAAYLGLGHWLAELRTRKGKWRGPIVCGLCAVAFAAGLALCYWVGEWWLLLSGLALLAGPIGLTLLSEDVIEGRLLARLTGWLWALVGVGAALLGVVLLMKVAEVSKELAWPLAAGLLVLVGAIASSSQADVLLVVTVLALAWTALPVGAGTGDALDPNGSGPMLVALGDSYMSGEGAARFFEGTNDAGENECRRAPTAYAHRLVEFDRADTITRLGFYACSGALADELHEEPKFGEIQLERLRADKQAGADIEVVIVSIGGNDADFSTIGAACLAPGSCVVRGEVWLKLLDDVAKEAEVAYGKIRGAVGHTVPIVVVPYPVPIAPGSCGYSLLEVDEHRFLHRYVKQLNGVLRQAARNARVYFLDRMAEAFSNDLRICDSERRQDAGVNFVALKSVNGLVDQALNPGKWIHNSLHPNELGHEAMATALDDWLRTHPPGTPGKPQGADIPQRFTRKSLEQLMGAAISYCGDTDGDQPAHCDRDDEPWAITQIGILLAKSAFPALVLVAGCWLIWLPVLARTRPRWSRIGACVARELTGAPPNRYPAGSAAATVQTASST